MRPPCARAALFGIGLLLAACGSAPRPAAPASRTAAAPAPARTAGVTAGYACSPRPAGRLAVVSQEGIFGQGETQVSKDGRIAAAQATPHQIQIWNLGGAGSKVAVVEMQDAVARFALEPDGRALALVSESRVWLKDLASGELRRLPVPAGDVEAIAWTTDGARLLVTRGQQVDLVDASSGTLQSILAVGAARGGVSPDGRWVLSRDGALWDVRKRRELWKASGPIPSASFSEDGRVLAYATGERSVVVVDAATGNRQWEAVAGARRGELALSPDGQSLAFHDDGRPKEAHKAAVETGLSLWHRGKKVRVPRAGEVRTNRPTFSADGTKVAFLAGAGDYASELRVAVTTTGARVAAPGSKGGFVVGGLARLESPRWSADGRIFYPGDSGLYVVDPAKGERRLVGKTVEGPRGAAVSDAVWSPDDSALLLLHERGDASGVRGLAAVLDLATGTLRQSLDARTISRSPRSRFTSAEWSSEGLVALVRSEGFVLWDPRSKEPARVVESASPANADRLVALSFQGALLATVPNASNEVRLWDPKTATRKGTLAVEDGRIEAMAFSSDGTRIAVAADLSSPVAQRADLFIYDTASSELVSKVSADARFHFGGASSLHWTPRGQAIVSVDRRGAVKLWSVASDELPLDLLARPALGPAALASGGNLLVTGQSHLDLWDLRTRTHATLPSGDGSAIQQVRVNHAGTIAAVTRQDHVDLFRISDGAHLTIRLTDSLDPVQGALLHDDEGVFAGSRTAVTELRVRDRAAPFEARAIRADEVAGLRRATLGRDFVAGCPVTGAR